MKVYRIKSIANLPYLNRVKNINIKSWNQIILVEMNIGKENSMNFLFSVLELEEAQLIRESWDFIILSEIEYPLLGYLIEYALLEYFIKWLFWQRD